MERNRHLFFIFLLLVNSLVVSQTQKLDSLKLALNKHQKNDSTKVILHNTISFENLNIDLKTSKSHALKANKLGKKLKYTDGEARSLYLLGVLELYNGNTKNAIESINKSINLYLSKNLHKEAIKGYDLLGSISLRQNNNTKAKYYYEKALKAAKENNYKLLEANFTANLAIYYKKENDYNTSIKLSKKAISIYESLNLHNSIANSLNNIAIIYKEQGKYLKALDYLKKSLDIDIKEKQIKDIPVSLNNIGVIYIKLNDFEKATNYIEKALKKYKELDDQKGIANSYITLGNIKKTKKKYNEALTLYNSAEKIYRKINNRDGLFYYHINTGIINLLNNKLDLSLQNQKKALEISDELNNFENKSHSLHQLGSIYFALKEYEKSYNFIKKSNEIAYELNLVEAQKKNHEILAKIHSVKKNYKKAYENHLQFKTLSDSLYNKENIEKLAQLEYEYKYKQEREDANKRELKLTEKVKIVTNNLEESQRNTFIGIIIFLTLFILLLAFIFFLRVKNIQAKNENILTEQKLLRSQMTPHFIFNSLSVLQGIILNKEEKKSVSYLSRFSKLLRIILENSRDGIVPLSEELKAIKNYLTLQNIHSSDFPFTHNIIIEDSVDIQKYKIPPMLIQPFIENAIEHAFIDKKENKKIDITLKLINNELICTVSDNGIGINTYYKKQNLDKKPLATTITSERLKILSKRYNTKGQIIIEDKKNNNEKGTLIIIKIPYKLAEGYEK